MDYPKSTPGIGLVDGRFVDENPTTGQPGSLIPSAWANALMDELLGIISAAGLSPDEADHTQLVRAIQSMASSDYKKSVRCATTGPIALSGVQTIDGVDLAVGDRVLVKDQAAASQNWIYVVSAGAWVRAQDADESTECTPGHLVPVQAGAVNGLTVWQLTNTELPTVGATALTFRIVLGKKASTLADYGITDAYRKDQTYSQAQVDDLLKNVNAMPVGSILPMPKATVPAGFLELDGSTQSIATYPDLAAYLGTTYNKGDEPAGYFRLPETRGEFLRGWDHGRGIDAGRAIGSAQAAETAAHTHYSNVRTSVSGNGDSAVTVYGPGNAVGTTRVLATSTQNYSDAANFPVSTAGGSETRPRSIAVMWCIKAWNAPVNQGNIDVSALAAEVEQLRALSLIGGRQGLKVSATGASSLVSVVADQLLLGNVAQAKKLTAINLSIDSSKVGSNGLDAGVLASSTWYSIWVIWGDAPGVAGLLSLSATAPTLSAGYTHKVRVGWIRTDGTANKYPLGFVQNGRNIQLLALRDMASGVLSQWTAIATGNYVPPTAAAVTGRAQNSNLICAVAPNASYDTYGVSYVYLPSGNGTAAQQFRVQLESANIYGYSTSSGSKISVLGWEDDL